MPVPVLCPGVTCMVGNHCVLHEQGDTLTGSLILVPCVHRNSKKRLERAS